MSEDPFEQIEELLSAMVGKETAKEAIEALRASGMDAEALSQMGGFEELSKISPSQMMAMQAQMQQMFSAGGDEPVNWKISAEVAGQGARQHGDPIITAEMAQQARTALQVADLWLDTATDFLPAPGTRSAWTRSQWAENTLPVWQDICTPVAEAVTEALSTVLSGQSQDLPEEMAQVAQQMGALSNVMKQISGSAFGVQLGQAIGHLGSDAFSATEIGLPLTTDTVTALVPANIAEFAQGLEIPEEETRMFLAVREAATARLYAQVPWLRGQVLGAVEAYAREIKIDQAAIETAMQNIDPTDPEAVQAALGSDMFSPDASAAQKAALEKLETLLAVVEGWVEVVTAQAVAPHLPHGLQLTEMMRRRRAQGGAAEQIFSGLIGLHFRPRRAREAAELWRVVGAQVEMSERDGYWQHPDLMPTEAELAAPASDFLTLRRAAAELESDLDADLASLLDGTLGYDGDAATGGALGNPADEEAVTPGDETPDETDGQDGSSQG